MEAAAQQYLNLLESRTFHLPVPGPESVQQLPKLEIRVEVSPGLAKVDGAITAMSVTMTGIQLGICQAPCQAEMKSTLFLL